MMTTRIMPAMEHNDAELVARSLAGDRDAFSQIVGRYQTLICSLAYSAMGHLGQSEDVAQETFITAWRHLGHLREPEKLRAWLCGIVRNRVHKSLRREGREPTRAAEPLDAAHDSPSPDALPSEQIISKEEEAILWRALERIPELYREPLILFYREHQSIEQVAAALDLSEDAVKQRLSRGRKQLQDEVVSFVEGALGRTAPGPAFSGAVLAALPMGAGSAATAGAGLAGKGAAAAKSGGALAVIAAWLAPVLGVIGAITAQALIIRSAPTRGERRIKLISFGVLWLIVLGWAFGGQLAVRALGRHWQWSDATFFAVMTGFWWVYAMFLATWLVLMFRKMFSAVKSAGPAGSVPTLSTARRVLVLVGVYLACFSWMIGLAWQAGDRFSTGLLTGAMVVLGGWQFLRARGCRSHRAVLQVTTQHQALVWGVLLAMLNWRLDSWLASIRGLNLAEMHRLLPMSWVHLLTLGLLAWAGALLWTTKPDDTGAEWKGETV